MHSVTMNLTVAEGLLFSDDSGQVDQAHLTTVFTISYIHIKTVVEEEDVGM